MRFRRMLIIALAAVGAFFATAGPALAQPSPSDDCEAKEGWTLCTKPVEEETTVTIGKVTVKASSIATGEVHFLLQGRAMTKAERRAAGPGGCFMASGLNSGVRNGVREYFPYGRTLVCRSSTSPTGYRRAACSNPFIPSFAPRPKNIRIFYGRVILTRNINAKITVKSESSVEAVGWIGDKICGRATGYGFAFATIRFRAFSKAQGRREVIDRTSGDASARAETRAEASVECMVTNPPPPPENKSPNISLTCPQHLFSEGTYVVWATVSDPDGDSLTVGYAPPPLGEWSGKFPHPSTPNKWGNQYTAPRNTGPGNISVTLTVSVSDGRGKPNSVATATCSFPVLAG